MKKHCECGRKIIAIRRITKRGKHKGALRVFSDRHHSLCLRCQDSRHEAEMQEQRFAPEFAPVYDGRRARLEQIYAEH